MDDGLQTPGSVTQQMQAMLMMPQQTGAVTDTDDGGFRQFLDKHVVERVLGGFIQCRTGLVQKHPLRLLQ